MSEVFQNLRHLRVLLAVADLNSVTLASEVCHVSQPAVTQTINKLERALGHPIFERSRLGFSPTTHGELLIHRTRRAFELLDAALNRVAPRLRITATRSQLQALIHVRDCENFTIAAKRLGMSQPALSRAVSHLEQDGETVLFVRRPHGLVATPECQHLARAARLAFAEFEQAESELGEFENREVGRIVIGALPMARSFALPEALLAFRRHRPTLPVTVIDGTYLDLLGGLRRGDIDMIVGALREPAPIDDVVERFLCHDRMVFVAGQQHPLAGAAAPSLEQLAGYPWVVPRKTTASRAGFDRLFHEAGLTPRSILEAGSVLFMRQLLEQSDHLGCISYRQAKAEIDRGGLRVLDVPVQWEERNFGVTLRRDWMPTSSQKLLLDLLAEVTAAL